MQQHTSLFYIREENLSLMSLHKLSFSLINENCVTWPALPAKGIEKASRWDKVLKIWMKVRRMTIK
jgi:hypothetical protein